MPAEVLGQLVRLPYPLTFSPRIEDFAIWNRKRSVPFVGVDVIASALQLSGGELAEKPKELKPGQRGIFVTPGLAKGGDAVELQINDTPLPFTVAGVIDNQRVNGDLVLLDIEDAEAVTGRKNKIDRILVSLPPQEKLNADLWATTLGKHLPAGVTVRPIGARKEENRKMLAAFRWNLRILSCIALLVGAFLIYNTISVRCAAGRRLELCEPLGNARLGAGCVLAGSGDLWFAGRRAGIVDGALAGRGRCFPSEPYRAGALRFVHTRADSF